MPLEYERALEQGARTPVPGPNPLNNRNDLVDRPRAMGVWIQEEISNLPRLD